LPEVAGTLREDLVPVVDREECMGFGYCAEMLPTVFSLDEEGKSVVATAIADPEALDEAVDGCPRGAISLQER
jgi:ferredoxin